MTKIKDFFKHIGKKFKQNWRKILLWSVLLIFAVCGMVYSWTRKNKGEIVSGSADTVSYDVSFLGSNVYVPLLTDMNGSYQYGAFSVVCSFNDTAGTLPTFVVNIQNVGFARVVSGTFNVVPFWEAGGGSSVDRYNVNFLNRSNGSLSSLWSHFYAWIDGRLSINTSFNVVGVRIYTTDNVDPRYSYVSSPCYTVFSYLTSISGLTYNFAFPYTSSGYADSLVYEDRYYYFDGFDPSYSTGYDDGLQEGIKNKDNAVNEAYTNGKNAGYNLAMETLNNNGAPTFLSLIDAVGYGVTKPFVSLLNFDLLGVNMLDFATSILTIFIVIKIITLFV